MPCLKTDVCWKADVLCRGYKGSILVSQDPFLSFLGQLMYNVTAHMQEGDFVLHWCCFLTALGQQNDDEWFGQNWCFKVVVRSKVACLIWGKGKNWGKNSSLSSFHFIKKYVYEIGSLILLLRYCYFFTLKEICVSIWHKNKKREKARKSWKFWSKERDHSQKGVRWSFWL